MTIIRKTSAAAGRSIAPTLLDRLTFTTISASDYDTIATGSSDNLSNFAAVSFCSHLRALSTPALASAPGSELALDNQSTIYKLVRVFPILVMTGYWVTSDPLDQTQHPTNGTSAERGGAMWAIVEWINLF